MGCVYLLIMQGLSSGQGEMYSVIGAYTSLDKAHEAYSEVSASIGQSNMYSETEHEVHEGVQLVIYSIDLDTTYKIQKSSVSEHNLYTTELLVGGVVSDD